MNDLAEKALTGLEFAYRAARSRALLTAGVIGCALSVVIVVAAGRVGATRATRPLTTWFGLQDAHGVEADDPVPATVLFLALIGLLLVWLVTVEIVRRRTPRERVVWAVFCAWAAPFAVGPPLFDSSVYSYAAFGLVQRAGHDPYRTPATGLGYNSLVEAVDPGTRGVPSGSGPLGTLVQHLAASVGVGTPLAVVIVLRVVAVLSVLWIGRLAADMGARRPARALSLTVLNPLLLLFVVSACRFEGPTTALVLAAVVAANRRAWTRSLALAAAAASLMGQAVVGVIALLIVHVRARRGRPAWQVAVRDVLVVAAVVAVFGLGVPDGFGWLRTVGDQFATHTPFSVADATSRVLSWIVRDAPFDSLSASSRVATVLAMVTVVGYLLGTARTRALERTAGYCLLAVGLLAPALYPWYAIPGLVCVAPSANAVRKIGVLGASSAACLLMPSGFDPVVTDVLAAVALGVVTLATAMAVRRKVRRGETGEDPELRPRVAAGRSAS